MSELSDTCWLFWYEKIKIPCWLFGCAYDPVDSSSPFACFRCCADVEGLGWKPGIRPFRKVYRWFHGWNWDEA